MRSNGLIILAIIAITAGGAFYVPQSSPSPSTKGTTASNAAGAAVETVAHEEPATDALDLIADYFGVDREERHAAQTVQLRSEAGQTPGTFKLSLETTPESGSKPSDDAWQQRIDFLRKRAGDAGRNVRFLIATLPDFVDSHMRWDFDAMLDAVQAGATTLGYVLDRFYLPDWDPTRDPGANAHRVRRGHEEAPGVVLLRHLPQKRVVDELLVVLIVPETPTTGISKRTFASAAGLVRAWNKQESTLEVRILGPMYSGSRESLKDAIRLVTREGSGPRLQFRIVSGSATDGDNKKGLEGKDPEVTFRATVLPDSQLEDALLDHIKPQIGKGRIARFLESNTGWGRRQVDYEESSKDGARAYIDIPFPLHISRLQSESDAVRASAAQNPAVPNRFLNLSFVEPQARDQLPVMTPKTTLPSAELVLASLLDQIRRERVSTVMITATDARDRLFLAHQLRTFVPNATLLTLEADLLYIHPSYAADTHGMLIASTYPLFPATQYWNDADTSQPRRVVQFRSTSAQGIYNATLALLGDSEAPLLDYGIQNGRCPSPCVPPVWISVVGRDGLWPIARAAPKDVGYVFRPNWLEKRVQSVPARPGAGNTDSPLAQPSMPALFAFVVVTVWTVFLNVAFLAQPASDRWFLIRRFDLRPQPGRYRYLLACFGTALFVQAFLAAVSRAAMAAQHAGALPPQSPMQLQVATAATLASLVLSLCSIVWLAVERRIPDRGTTRVAADQALVALLGVGAAYCLAQYGWRVMQLEPVPALLFVDRVVHPGNQVSPAVPILTLGGAVYLWALLNLRRLGMPRPERVSARLELVKELMAFDDAPSARASSAGRRAPLGGDAKSWLVLAPILVIGLIFWQLVDLRSHEGYDFDRFYWWGSAIVYSLVFVALVRQLTLWTELRRVLRLLAWHPLIEAFKRLPSGTFKATISAEAPDLLDLGPLVHRGFGWVTPPAIPAAARLAAAGRLEPAHAGATLGLQRGISDPHVVLEVIEAEPTELQTIDGQFQTELSISPAIAWTDSRTWTSIKPSVDAAAMELRPLWRLRTAIPPHLAALEETVAIAVGLSIREILARLANCALFIMGSLFLVLASHSLFPFYPRQILLTVSWVFILAAIVTSLAIFVGIDRDEALSHISGTMPGKVNWDTTTLSRFIVYGLIPLASLIAVQFPELGDSLLRWIQPVQRALP